MVGSGFCWNTMVVGLDLKCFTNCEVGIGGFQGRGSRLGAERWFDSGPKHAKMSMRWSTGTFPH